jgi:hypothetical protein
MDRQRECWFRFCNPPTARAEGVFAAPDTADPAITGHFRLDTLDRNTNSNCWAGAHAGERTGAIGSQAKKMPLMRPLAKSRIVVPEMPATFEPRLDILPESQRLLWPELDAVPSAFVLYGGTGLALQLGHRVSEDFDFFSSSGFDPDRLRSVLPFFRNLDPSNSEAWVQCKRDNLEAFVDRSGLVRVAFFGGLDTLHRVEEPRHATGSRVRVASLVDLAGMKMRVIQVRGSWKDYVDIHTLVTHGIDVPTGLAAAKAIDRTFDPITSVRALQFYGDGTLSRVPAAMQQDLTRWAQAVDLSNLPVLHPRRGLSPGDLER